MKTFIILLLSTSLAWSAQVGDIRMTDDGKERCIVEGQYETWALIEPSAQYKAKMKADRELNEAKEEDIGAKLKDRQDALEELIQERVTAKKGKK